MKSGLEYFPLDVYLDEKFELIEAEFGLKGFAVIVKLLQRIYGQRGYYCEWTEEIATLFGRNCHYSDDYEKSINAVSTIVRAAIKRGIFDSSLYEKYGILTSAGIQRRYLEACARRKEVRIDQRYLLLCNTQLFKNAYISSENEVVFSENVDIPEQSKVKESKEKKSKVCFNICENDASADASESTNYQEIIDSFNRICIDLPKVRDLTDARRTAIRKAQERLRHNEGFDAFFERINNSDFLCGRGGKWKCSFDWVLKPSNMIKILEGNFDNRTSSKKSVTTQPMGRYNNSFDEYEKYEKALLHYVPKYKKKES